MRRDSKSSTRDNNLPSESTDAMLFDERKRNDYRSAQHTESLFAYLNYSARIEFVRIRRELEKWFARYPISERINLRKDFRSDKDSQHQAAFFELFLHELLLRLGCRVTIHPAVPNTSHSPDFLVDSPNGEHFYLEAKVATNLSEEKAAAQKRENAVFDVLDRKVDSPDFYLSLEIYGTSTTSPPVNKIALSINEYLGNLNYDEIVRLYESERYQDVPTWTFQDEGWRIKFRPIPKGPEARGRSGVRPIGLRFKGWRRGVSGKPIRKSITKKAGNYGDLDLPYVIAVNALGFHDDTDILDALFGTEQFTVLFSQNESSDPIDILPSRSPDGAWTAPNGPQYTRVSAVLLASQLSEVNIPRANLRLYHNPWAQRPYKSVLTRLPQAVLKDNRMERIDGESTEAIFNLPALWPGDGD